MVSIFKPFRMWRVTLSPSFSSTMARSTLERRAAGATQRRLRWVRSSGGWIATRTKLLPEGSYSCSRQAFWWARNLIYIVLVSVERLRDIGATFGEPWASLVSFYVSHRIMLTRYILISWSYGRSNVAALLFLIFIGERVLIQSLALTYNRGIFD